MLHAKFQDHRTSGSGEDFLKVFTIYGHGSHLVICTKLVFPLPMEAPHKIWLKLAKWFQRKRCVNIVDDDDNNDDDGALVYYKLTLMSLTAQVS